MARFHQRGKDKVPFTAEEETARDAEEAAYAVEQAEDPKDRTLRLMNNPGKILIAFLQAFADGSAVMGSGMPAVKAAIKEKL